MQKLYDLNDWHVGAKEGQFSFAFFLKPSGTHTVVDFLAEYFTERNHFSEKLRFSTPFKAYVVWDCFYLFIFFNFRNDNWRCIQKSYCIKLNYLDLNIMTAFLLLRLFFFFFDEIVTKEDPEDKEN